MDDVPKTRKDLLAKKCADRGIVFMPVANRSVDGKQVYKCGNSSVYLDRNDVFVSRGGMWLHTDMEELLRSAL